MWNRSIFVFLFALVPLAGCTKTQELPDDPKRILTEYVSRSFAVKNVADKSGLSIYLTGDAKRRLETWSEDQFRQAFIDSHRTFVKLAMREVKTVSPLEVSVTYEITYLDQNRGHDARVTNKKLAQIVRATEAEKWLIQDVHNIKELVEYQNEMAL